MIDIRHRFFKLALRIQSRNISHQRDIRIPLKIRHRVAILRVGQIRLRLRPCVRIDDDNEVQGGITANSAYQPRLHQARTHQSGAAIPRGYALSGDKCRAALTRSLRTWFKCGSNRWEMTGRIGASFSVKKANNVMKEIGSWGALLEF